MAKVIEFEAGSAASIEIKGTWYKFSCSARVSLDPEDELDSVKKKTWNTVHAEIERQVDETIKDISGQ